MTIVSLPILIGIAPWIVILFFSRTMVTEAGLANVILSNIGVLFFSIIMFAIGILISIALNGGFERVLYDALKGKARFETMLKVAKEKFWTILGANLLVLFIFLLIIGVLLAPIAILILASSFSGASFLYLFVIILTVILGLIVLVVTNIFFVFVNPAIVIDNLKAVDAVKRSFEVSRRKFLQIFLIFLIYFIINSGLENVLFILGSIITAFVTTPMLLLSYIIFYVENSKKRK